MPRFFVEPTSADHLCVSGPDGHHIARVLRVRVGEKLTCCDGQGTDYACEVEFLDGDAVTLRVLSRSPSVAEPSTAVTLYQGLPKSEKMEFIIQKAVEIGITRIVPVSMSRSIVRLKGDEGRKKQLRWQKIAAEAAGQSGRGVIPTVSEPISFAQAAEEMKTGLSVVFYEGGGCPLSRLVTGETTAVSFMVGPEGGIEPEEIAVLREAGVHVATLGKRILRCETAPLVALSVMMQLTGNLE